MSRTAILFLAALPLFAAALPPESALDALNYSGRRWQSQDGLPEDFAQSLAQTQDGYLWIGTSGGLVRFDGARFAVFGPSNEPAFQDDSVYSLLASTDGSLWIGTEGGGLLRYRAGAFRAYGAKDGLTNGFVRVIFEDRKGGLWVGTDRGLFKMRNDTLARIDGRDGIPAVSVHTICEDRKGRLLVGGGGILVLGDGAPAYYRSSGNFAENSVRAISEDAAGAVWIGSISGLRKLEHGIDGNPFLRPKVVDNLNISVLRVSADTLWIGTYGHGLLRYKNGQMVRITAPQGLPHNNVLAAYIDRERDVWIGTQGGLQRMSPSIAHTIPAPDSAPQSMNTVYQDPNGMLLVTSLSGRLSQIRDKALAPFPLAPHLRALPIRNAFRARDGALWLGTDGHGAIRIRPGGTARYTMNDGLVNDFVRAFCEDHAGNIWIGADGGLSRWREGQFQNFDAESGLVYGSVRTIVEDSQKTLWIGTDRGVSRFVNGVIAADATIDRLRGQKVWAIYEDRDRGIWFGTHGAGLFLLKGGQFSQFTVKDGIPAKIHFIAEDRRGDLWLSSPAGIFSVARRDLETAPHDVARPVAVRLYSTSDGLSTNQMNGGVQPAGAVSKSGDLWFPSTKGVVTLAPGASREGTPPRVVLEQALVDDRNAPIEGTHLWLAPGRGKLELHYTAIRLRSPERLRFSYWMEGLEPEWTQAGERRVAYFTNMPPGDFRFHVAAYDVDDPRRVVEQVLSIHWQPPFFRSWWFIALCGAAALGLVLTAYGVHTRNVRKRFAAVLDERNRVAREMHDTVIQGCVGVSALLEAASSAQETSPAVSRTMLERARDEIRVTVEDARSAVWNLRRAADGEDIADAISRLVHRVGADSGIAVELKSSGTPIALGADAERSLLLSVREAVWNAVRHASPRHIAVALAFGNRELTVAIEDDGSGFDCSPDATREATHYGLIGMRERVEKLGGRFDLSSRPGAGTCVRITIPHHGLF